MLNSKGNHLDNHRHHQYNSNHRCKYYYYKQGQLQPHLNKCLCSLDFEATLYKAAHPELDRDMCNHPRKYNNNYSNILKVIFDIPNI